MSSLKESILEIIRKPQLAGLATITEEGNPWVRYVMAVGEEDFTIRFATFINARKASQIKKNPEVHLNCGVMKLMEMQPYLQIQGRAHIVTAQDEKD